MTKSELLELARNVQAGIEADDLNAACYGAFDLAAALQKATRPPVLTEAQRAEIKASREKAQAAYAEEQRKQKDLIRSKDRFTRVHEVLSRI